jgi:hypothetical protein
MIETQQIRSVAAPSMSAPWATTPVPLPPPPSAARRLADDQLDPIDEVAGANWLVHESRRKDIQIRITEHDLFLDEVHVAAADITNVAFWSERSTHHEFIIVTPSTKLTFCLRDDRVDLTPSVTDFVAIVRYLEGSVIPRLVQHRLQRIDMGMKVSFDRLTADRAGLSWASRPRARAIAWTDFDHVTIHRDHIEIVARRGRKLNSFAHVPLTALDVVLVPMLLVAATSVFGKPTSP